MTCAIFGGHCYGRFYMHWNLFIGSNNLKKRWSSMCRGVWTTLNVAFVLTIYQEGGLLIGIALLRRDKISQLSYHPCSLKERVE